ncbi:hypothetical protein HK104_001672 [Borealophlyctis nickersoniae]|nr:hypothetical protein HK104_001672 [Borealophlyctis nickersoniae]
MRGYQAGAIREIDIRGLNGEVHLHKIGQNVKVLRGTRSLGHFGRVVSAAESGEGVWVSEPMVDGERGRLYKLVKPPVTRGKNFTVSTIAQRCISGTARGERSGSAVVAVDVDGDGMGDVVVASEEPGSGRGKVHIVWG